MMMTYDDGTRRTPRTRSRSMLLTRLHRPSIIALSLFWWISCNPRISSRFIVLSWRLRCLVTYADSRRGPLVGFVRPCVCRFFPLDISKIDAARITELDIVMFHDKSWKPIYFGIKSSKIRVPKTLPTWVFALLWLLTSSS